MAFNFNYGFTPEQLKKLMTPPTPPPTGIETMADKVGMGDFTAEVPVAETFDYRGFNPFNPTGVPGSPNTGGIVPPPGWNPFNPYGGPWTGVVPDVTAPVVDPIANLTPMPPRDTNVRVPTNYPRKALPPTFSAPSINPFKRPEE